VKLLAAGAQKPGNQLARSAVSNPVHGTNNRFQLVLHAQSEHAAPTGGRFVVYEGHTDSEGAGTASEWISQIDNLPRGTIGAKPTAYDSRAVEKQRSAPLVR